MNDPNAARDFASRFFGVAPDSLVTVHERYEPEVWAATRTTPAEITDPGAALEKARQAVEDESGDAVRALWAELGFEALPDDECCAALHATLSANEILYQASDILEHPQSLAELLTTLAERVDRPVSEEELIFWLTLGAAARVDGRPLVRPVVHGFVRGVPGAVVTFDLDSAEPQLHLSAEDDEDEDQRLRMKVSSCTTCGQHYFSHCLADFEYIGGAPGGGNTAGDDGIYWEPMDEAHEGTRVLFVDSLISQDDDETPDDAKKLSLLHLCRGCGAAHSEPGNRCLACGCEGERLGLHAIRQKAKSVGFLATCVCCGAVGRKFAGRFRAPAKPVRATHVADAHVLSQDMVHNADRERLLLFADNRQDAAFQAGWMRDHARRFRLRAFMMDELNDGPLSIGDLAHKLDNLLEADDSLSRALVPEVWALAKKEAAGRIHRDYRRLFLRIQVLLELTVPGRQQIGLEPWGQVKVNYTGLNESDPFIQKWARALQLPADELKGGVEDILDRTRRRKQLYDSLGEVFTKFQGLDNTERQNGFIPDLSGVPKGLKLRRAVTDDADRLDQWLSDGHQTTMSEAAKKWGVDPDDIPAFVTELWQYLTEPSVGLLREVFMKGSRGNTLPNCHGAHQIDGDRLIIAANTSGVYRCKTCRRRTVRRTPMMKCLAWRCDGMLEFVPEDPDSYDLQLIKSHYTMLRPREHTAMVPTAEREKLEQIFKGESDAVNVLVCTQTLEMGVDIGALDAILMRNVPPSPANYWQRAGRAGRRHRMAVNLTYCRQVNHDRAYFDDPLKMLNGRVDPPSFNMSNELMVAKHVHATVITALFKLGRDDASLTEQEREEINDVLHACFPQFTSAYLFDETGALRLRPFEVSRLMVIIDNYHAQVTAAVQRAFAQGWPERDAAAVTDDRLKQHVNDMPQELQQVVNRLFRRLKWATTQMEDLGRIRARFGALDDEQESFYNRCNRYVRRVKGARRRGRAAAEGVDDIVTYSVLASEGFLPGYGLESGSVVGMAQVPISVVGLNDFDLPRPPSIAIREYVPGNLIYANGQRFVPRRYYRDVSEDKAEELQLEVSLEREAIHAVHGNATGDPSATEVTSIPICDVLLLHQSRISDEEENRFQMGVSIYGRELDQHNGGQAYLWGDKSVQLRKNLRLQLVNVGPTSIIQSSKELGYQVCRVCGQSASPYSSEKQRNDFTTKHQEQCGRRAQGIAFHADLAVDALTLKNCSDREEAYSLIESIRFAACDLLEMELRDLQVQVIGHTDSDLLDAHLYDPMPGGSGLLEQVCHRFDEVVRGARELADHCPGLCKNSCIDCFQNYRNAFYHKHLNRLRLVERIDQLGFNLVEVQPIPAKQPQAGPVPTEQPTNVAERKLRDMLAAASFPAGQWQIQRPLPRPLISTTPDVTFDDPDDDEVKIFIYLDGLSQHLHGNPETADMDRQIRSELRGQGHEVIEITAHDLDDPQQMTGHFKKLARYLDGGQRAREVAANVDLWFQPDGAVRDEPQLSVEPEPVSAVDDACPLPLSTEESTDAPIPVYEIQAAASDFAAGEAPEPMGWTAVDGRRVTDDMFIIQVVGHSMEPTIPSGAWCLFRSQPGGSRNGRILLVQHHGIADPDHGGTYTVKEYGRALQDVADGEERRGDIALKPTNPNYGVITIGDGDDEITVIGEFTEVVAEPGEPRPSLPSEWISRGKELVVPELVHVLETLAGTDVPAPVFVHELADAGDECVAELAWPERTPPVCVLAGEQESVATAWESRGWSVFLASALVDGEITALLTALMRE